MDGSAFRNFDLGRGLMWLFVLAVIGAICIGAGLIYVGFWAWHHVGISIT